MALTGLLLLTSSTINLTSRTRVNLSAAKKRLSGVLYVYPWKLETENGSPSPSGSSGGAGDSDSRRIQKFGRISSVLYSQATAQCPNLDIRLLLKKPTSIMEASARQSLDLVMIEPEFKSGINKVNVESLVKDLFPKKSEKYNLEFLGQSLAQDTVGNSKNQLADEEVKLETETQPVKIHDVVALGGTFDRMHNAHKILITEAVLRCKKELIVGVTDDEMIKSKVLFELIEPFDIRIARVKNFLNDVAPFLSHRVVPLTDPFGPTITDKDVSLIVVSSETVAGANKINEIRQKKNFPPLEIHHIKLFADPDKQNEQEEDKISSSSERIRILGDRLHPARKPPSSPYIIGLTGGIASGKSTLCSYLETLGVSSINCDHLGHQAYTYGTACFDQLIATFGEEILLPGGQEINRRGLGLKVFGNTEEMKKLTNIVWPEIRRLAIEQIAQLTEAGKKVIVLDAAVLLEAGFDDLCHDVWVVIIPKEEAIKRVQNRDNMSREAAEARVNSQVNNHEKVYRATFVFSSLWEVSFTRKQVDRAWRDIKPLIDQL